MPQLITIGETMAAFTPSSPGPLRYVQGYGIRCAGAESNVAIGLAKLGISAAWISRLGQDEFGHFICNQIRAEGVDCRHVIFDSSHRTGLMFKETGVSETKVYYYRENSAASHMVPDDLNESAFEESKILHLSGITPILSETCKETVQAAVELAKKHHVMISFDPNIRKRLWGNTDYVPLIRSLTLKSDIVLLGLDEAKVLFDTEDAEKVAEILHKEGNAKYVAVKDGAKGASVTDFSVNVHIPPYPCRPIEPIGAGDGFNAGFLAGLLQGEDVETAGKMGGICGALATMVSGDVEGYPDKYQMEAALNGKQVIYR